MRRYLVGIALAGLALTADEVVPKLCTQIPDDQGNLEIASGNAWLSVTLSTVGVGAAQVAEALGGEAVKIKDFCA